MKCNINIQLLYMYLLIILQVYYILFFVFLSMQRVVFGGFFIFKLLDKILVIFDLYRRKFKIEIYLETLQEEIDNIEVRIQECIVQNVTFYEDEEYGRLFRKKGFLQREKIELEKYEKELDKVLVQQDQMYYFLQWFFNYQQ